MNKVLLLKNTFEKMRNSDMVSQERLLDVNMTFFCFLDKTLLMAPSVQINSFLNDFRLFFIYQNIILVIVKSDAGYNIILRKYTLLTW